MKILFVHQNFPAQYKHLGPHFARDPKHRVAAISKSKLASHAAIRRAQYKVPGEADGPHGYLGRFEDGVRHGHAVARAAQSLKAGGFRPDVICVHPGWGEAIYLPDVFPGVPQLHYCEFYFHAFGGAIHFDPKEKPRVDTMARTRMRNTVNLLSLECMDWGISPMHWQHSQYPAEFRHRISVLHDGVDTRTCRANPAARIRLRDGTVLTRDHEVLTYVSRNLEPVRGFPSLVRAAAEICGRRPECHVVVVGGDGVSYSGTLPKGQTYRQNMLEEVPLDLTRVHFLGRVPYPFFLRLLQVSRAHLYLTMPFVLSWSMLEAMSAECLVIGSRTAPVMEAIEDGVNGLLVDFFDIPGIADRVCEALAARDSMPAMRRRARETVQERWDLANCLPAQAALIEDVAAGRRAKPSPWPVAVPPELPPLPESPARSGAVRADRTINPVLPAP